MCSSLDEKGENLAFVFVSVFLVVVVVVVVVGFFRK